MSKFIVEFASIDWRLLRDQKGWLLDTALMSGNTRSQKCADGLINLLDYIQDAAEEQGQPVVWLDEEDKDVYAGCLE
jgi:hypothetical protein